MYQGVVGLMRSRGRVTRCRRGASAICLERHARRRIDGCLGEDDDEMARTCWRARVVVTAGQMDIRLSTVREFRLVEVMNPACITQSRPLSKWLVSKQILRIWWLSDIVLSEEWPATGVHGEIQLSL